MQRQRHKSLLGSIAGLGLIMGAASSMFYDSPWNNKKIRSKAASTQRIGRARMNAEGRRRNRELRDSMDAEQRLINNMTNWQNHIWMRNKMPKGYSNIVTYANMPHPKQFRNRAD